MKINTLIYSLKQGLKNIGRNKMFSIASISTMAACIFLFSIFFSIIVNFRSMVNEAESGVAVTVFFDEGISQQRIDEIGDIIKKRVEVSSINYVSAEEAWESFVKDYLGEGNEQYAEGFKDDNPLADSANYEVYLNDISMQSALVTYLESVDGVREVRKSEVVANTLSSFNILIGYVSVAIIVILLGVAIFLISNTITIGISVRKEEIGIMKLIGATDSFVRAPFIVEGLIIGIIGAIIPLVLFYILYNRVVDYVVNRFSILNQLLTFLTINDIYKTLVPVALALGLGIGLIGSMITVRKHLNV